jgi:hypothetical protein
MTTRAVPGQLYGIILNLSFGNRHFASRGAIHANENRSSFEYDLVTHPCGDGEGEARRKEQDQGQEARHEDWQATHPIMPEGTSMSLNTRVTRHRRATRRE